MSKIKLKKVFKIKELIDYQRYFGDGSKESISEILYFSHPDDDSNIQPEINISKKTFERPVFFEYIGDSKFEFSDCEFSGFFFKDEVILKSLEFKNCRIGQFVVEVPCEIGSLSFRDCSLERVKFNGYRTDMGSWKHNFQINSLFFFRCPKLMECTILYPIKSLRISNPEERVGTGEFDYLPDQELKSLRIICNQIEEIYLFYLDISSFSLLSASRETKIHIDKIRVEKLGLKDISGSQVTFQGLKNVESGECIIENSVLDNADLRNCQINGDTKIIHSRLEASSIVNTAFPSKCS